MRDRRLQSLHDCLATVDLDDRALFTRLLKEGKDLLGISITEVCNEFDVSRIGVERWLDGANAPVRALRELILRWLAARVKAAMRAD